MAYRFRIVLDFHFFESHRLRFHLERGHVSYMNFKQVRMNVYCACRTQTCLEHFRSVVSRGLATSNLKKVLDVLMLSGRQPSYMTEARLALDSHRSFLQVSVF